MSVFPNDIRWLRCRLKFNVFTQEFTKTCRNDALLNLLVYCISSTITFLCFKSCKAWTWSLKLIKLFLILQDWWDIFVYFFNFIPFFSFDCISSFFQNLYNFCIIESKSNLSYFLTFCCFISIDSLIFHSVDTIFNFILDIKFKLG